MKIIGFAFKKISAEKSESVPKDIKINHNIELKDIVKDKIENLNQEVLRIEFNFVVKYDPKFGEISIQGYVLLALDAEKSKEVLKKWKSKKVSDDIKIPLFNFIMTKCNIKAINLEDDVGLPLHVPMPRLSNQQPTNRSYVQ